MTDPTEGPSDEPKSKQSKAERDEAEKARLLAALASGTTDKLHERVAWLLSTQPDTRNSDIALQLAFWKAYQPELLGRLSSQHDVMFRLTRLTSIARARAKIQNTYRLFEARAEVKKRRGTLSEEERARHAEDSPPEPQITIYADETGKTGQELIIGSVWFLNPLDTVSLVNRVQAWRIESGFQDEFHMSDALTANTLPFYLQFVDLVFSAIPLISFKSIRVPRAGIRSAESTYETLFFELVTQGVQHEDTSRRAPLPRAVMLYKDRDEPGRDKMMLAQLRERLATASNVSFAGKLRVEECIALDSKSQPLLQLADLYAGCLNRETSRTGTSAKPKDVFTDYFLGRVRSLAGVSTRGSLATEDGDVEIKLQL